MELKNQYQMRVRKNVSDTYLADANENDIGLQFSDVKEINNFTVNLPSIQAVLDETSKLDQLKGYEIISIILIDQDNYEHLGSDFNWENHA
ncbi:hypothetical protein [Acinetobacter towneri]|uniref:hypothetical protein n=1 Tax=Acinetobacter towneri TaxID=202956 RepID=UPI00336C226F